MPTPPKPSENNNQDNRFGATTGTDLLAPVILNENPYDIESIGGHPPSYTWEKWRLFQLYIKGKDPKYPVEPIDKSNTELNSNKELKAKITESYINGFNTNSVWSDFGTSNPHRGKNNPLTREDIFAIQRFTQKSDSKVIIDGWLGTQTLQMDYPKTVTLVRGFTDNSGKKIPGEFSDYLLPVTWGNKKFVTSFKNQSNSQIPYAEKLIPFNPSIHTSDKFEAFPSDTLKKAGRNIVNALAWSLWTQIDANTQPKPNSAPEQINKETKKQQIQSENKARQESIIKYINKQ